MAAHEYRSGANELNLACPNNLDHSIANRGKFRIGEIPDRATDQTRMRGEKFFLASQNLSDEANR
jgi:hypothetical protein